MKLTLSHDDVISGICSFLEKRGLTGFDPSKVHADFTKGRDGKLSVVLDDSAPVQAVVAQKAAEKKEAKASEVASGGSATAGGENAAEQAETLSEAAPADKADAVAAEVPAETAKVDEPATTQEAGEENLFG